jgi:hypothetical protein
MALTMTPARALDLHAFWDQRCAECHGHAGPFARATLSVKNGVLSGRHNRDLKQFLAQHEAGAAQAGGIYGMLLAQAATAPVYQQKCAGCHDTAAAFARQSLVVRDGVLVGKDNGLPVAEFLKRHGRLSAAEVPTVLEALTRVMAEIGAAPKK